MLLGVKAPWSTYYCHPPPRPCRFQLPLCPTSVGGLQQDKVMPLMCLVSGISHTIHTSVRVPLLLYIFFLLAQKRSKRKLSLIFSPVLILSFYLCPTWQPALCRGFEGETQVHSHPHYYQALFLCSAIYARLLFSLQALLTGCPFYDMLLPWIQSGWDGGSTGIKPQIRHQNEFRP